MDREKIVIELVITLLELSDDLYQKVKDYWEEHPSNSENFIRQLFAFTDKKRKTGVTNDSA